MCLVTNSKLNMNRFEIILQRMRLWWFGRLREEVNGRSNLRLYLLQKQQALKFNAPIFWIIFITFSRLFTKSK